MALRNLPALALCSFGVYSVARSLLGLLWDVTADWVLGDSAFWPWLTFGDLDEDGWLR